MAGPADGTETGVTARGNQARPARVSSGMRALALVAVLFAAVACSGDEAVTTSPTSAPTTAPGSVPAPGDQGDLDRARDRWERAGIEDYTLAWSQLCFCPYTAFVDTVVDGISISHVPEPASEGTVDPGPTTMTDLFDAVQDAIDTDPADLDVVYDPDTGAVVSFFVDVSEMMADEEYGIEATVVPAGDTPSPPAPTELDLAALTVDHACGFGFQAGTPDQTVALVLAPEGGPVTTGPVTLPDPAWSATVDFGRDLFANWCDDVVEPGEPSPVTVTTWELVEGALEVTVPDGTYGEATVVASGLVAESPDGSRVPLGDITIVNEFYGTVAG